MVVIVLFGIMTAMILPEMRGSYEDALLRSTARKLVSVFNLASSRAVSIGQPHRVRLDKKNGRYFLERSGGESGEVSGFVPVQDASESEGELEGRIEIEVRKRGEGTSLTTEPEERSLGEDLSSETGPEGITFYPDGTADDGEIVLRDREGFRLALRINSTTARVRIVDLERESRPGASASW